MPLEILSSDLLEVLAPNYKTNLLYRLKDTEALSRLEKLLNLGGALSQIVKDNLNYKGFQKFRFSFAL